MFAALAPAPSPAEGDCAVAEGEVGVSATELVGDEDPGAHAAVATSSTESPNANVVCRNWVGCVIRRFLFGQCLTLPLFENDNLHSTGHARHAREPIGAGIERTQIVKRRTFRSADRVQMLSPFNNANRVHAADALMAIRLDLDPD